MINLNRSVYDLDISTRLENCLICERITSIGELVNYTEADLLKIHGLGKKSLEEIKLIFDKYGLFFGMNYEKPDLMKGRFKRIVFNNKFGVS